MDGQVPGAERAARPHAVDVALINIVAVAAGQVVISVEFVVIAAGRLDGLGVVAARRRLGRGGPSFCFKLGARRLSAALTISSRSAVVFHHVRLSPTAAAARTCTQARLL